MFPCGDGVFSLSSCDRIPLFLPLLLPYLVRVLEIEHSCTLFRYVFMKKCAYIKRRESILTGATPS